MIDYRAPTRDQLFALHHGADASRLSEWDDDIARQVLTEAARFVEGEIAPLDPVGDANCAELIAGRVRMPAPFGLAYRRYREAGWPGLAADSGYGGQGLPAALAGALTEMLAGACVSFQMVLGLANGAMRAITANASPEQKARYLPPLIAGDWLATMCLTESQAGSDLASIRSVALPAGDGGFRLTGSKIFISGGDQDLTNNILHLVLARTPEAAPGVKGLSLFLCPAVLPDGTRNRVSCVRLEEKMGLHASPTCQMAFDGAHAELLGVEGEGLAYMFVMMNAERLDTALQGVGLAEVASQRARAFAAQRLQGRGPDGAGPVPINRHADVRRMLLTQRALTEGCRALLYRTLVELELGASPALVDFLTPVCKAFVTDSSIEVANLAVQIHGGYGYLKEYRVEQVVRDARITAIYEGTNGIQAHTLAERVLRRAGGAPAAAFRADIEAAIACAAPSTAPALAAALDHWQQTTENLLRREGAGATATAYLRLTGLLALGAAWARMEAAAASAPFPERIAATAAFYRTWLLPECVHLARLVTEAGDVSSLAEAIFSAD
jgi:hypothetical protein